MQLIEPTHRRSFTTTPPDLGARSAAVGGLDSPDRRERHAERRQRVLGSGDARGRQRDQQLVVLAARGGELERVSA
jgi:hypothetical protein